METIHIASCSFGKDSVATVLLALENNEPLDRVVFAEVMFDIKRNISGEIPEHIEWVYSTAIPKLESMGVKVDVVRAQEDYVTLFNKYTTERSQPKYRGKKRGFPVGKKGWCNSNLKITPIRNYYKQFKSFIIKEYVGIAIDEPKRLERLGNKISLLQKYGYTEQMAFDKAKEYDLLSPLYSTSYRGGCWFCPSMSYNALFNFRQRHPDLWNELRVLSKTENLRSNHFKYSESFEDVDKRLDKMEHFKRKQLNIFLFST